MAQGRKTRASHPSTSRIIPMGRRPRGALDLASPQTPTGRFERRLIPVTTSAARHTMPRAKSGWVWFAAIMLIIAGGFNLIHGFVALDRKQFITTQIAYSNLTFWGGGFVILGVLQVSAGAPGGGPGVGGEKSGGDPPGGGGGNGGPVEGLRPGAG